MGYDGKKKVHKLFLQLDIDINIDIDLDFIRFCVHILIITSLEI